MKFTELKPVVINAIDAGLSIELRSAPGRGKSEFTRQLKYELSRRDGFEWGYGTLFLATQTPPDLIGYQFKGERNWDGKTVAVTEPTLPSWMMTEDGKPVWAYERGILVLDEYGQGEADVKRASAELLLNKQLGPWKLPPGWGVIACSNRASDRSGVTKSFDFVINRRMEIDITDDIGAWEEWALTNGVTPLVIAFAHQHPHVVFSDGVPEKQGPWCTPRSLIMAERYLKAASKGSSEFPDDPSTIEAVGGLIGPGAAAQLFGFVKLEREMPKFETICNNPDKAKVPDKPDAQMLIAYNLAHRVDEDSVSPVITYMNRMGKEFGVTFMRAMCKRAPKLVQTPAVMKWTKENSSLMAQVTAIGH